MRCQTCKKIAIFSNPDYCAKHFIKYFEDKIRNTIKKYNLISKKEKVIVATSGGKDSITILFVLKKLGYQVDALAIDEGIHGYREHTLKDLKNFCKKNKIKLRIISFKSEYGKTLDEMLKNKKNINPCTVCGTFRRFLLNKYAKGYDKIVTGHNLDDEAQAIFMNIMRNQIEVNARIGPFSGIIKEKKFIPRVKPLYFCTEKEVLAYSYLNGFISKFTECIYESESFRSRVRDFLNDVESNYPGFKKTIISNYISCVTKLKQHFRPKSNMKYCINCGEPAHREICKNCELRSELNL